MTKKSEKVRKALFKQFQMPPRPTFDDALKAARKEFKLDCRGKLPNYDGRNLKQEHFFVS
jgi:hypothetical protein